MKLKSPSTMLLSSIVLFLGFYRAFAQQALQTQNLVLAVVDLDQGEFHGSGTYTITMLRAIETGTVTPVSSFNSTTDDFISLPGSLNSTTLQQLGGADPITAFNNTSINTFHHTNTPFSLSSHRLIVAPTNQVMFTGLGNSLLLPSFHHIAISFLILKLVIEAM